MAAANVYPIADPPQIEYIFGNTGGQDIKCLNYMFLIEKLLGEKRLVMLVQGAMHQLALKWLF